MNILVFIFIGFFALTALAVGKSLINKRKRNFEAKEYEQRRKAELEAREHKLRTLEERIEEQKQNLEEKGTALKKEADILNREREDIAAMQKRLNTDEEKIAEEHAMLEKKMQEHLTRERQLQDIDAELESKSKHLATFEESLKNTSEELAEKDLKLTARKEELEVRNAELMKEKQELNARDVELKAFQDELKSEKEEIEHKIAEITEDKKKLIEEHAALKISRENIDRLIIELDVRTRDLKAMESEITAQKQEIAAKEDALKKEADALIQERENLAAIRQELNTEAERIAGASAMLNAKEQEHLAKEKELKDIATELKSRSEQLTASEELLKKISEDITARDLELTASRKEIEVHAAALVREKEDLDARDAELKALQEELKSEHDKLEQRINELKEFHERLTSKEKSFYSHESKLKTLEDELQKKGEVVTKLLTKISGDREYIDNEMRLLEEKIADIERRESALIECNRTLKTKEDKANSRAQQEGEQTADEGSQEKAKKKPLLPNERGGRPRGQSEESEIEQKLKTKPRSLKPEIVCWKDGLSWVIGIEVPEGLESFCVTHEGEILEQDGSDELCYRLKHAGGIVNVKWAEGYENLSLIESKRNCLIFKMRKNWKDPGRLVQRPSIGHYLVIAPQEWERDEETSGLAHAMPESTYIEGYQAHFFYLDKKYKAISFIKMNGERVSAEYRRPRFKLIGNEINDASEDMGPLFGEEPPRIKVLDEKGWGDVGMIVLGEEGGGRNRWRKSFTPQLAENEQKLPEELTFRHGGWYFVRIYDNDYNLLESMDFRFMAGLREIKIYSHSFLPVPSGHQPVRVEFLHEPHCQIQLAKGDSESLQIKHEDELMSAIIPSHPAWDVTDWEIKYDGQKIKVEIMIERIWWCLTENDSLSSTELFDRPLSIEHDSFNASSIAVILLWFPEPRWVQTILVGFEKSKSRPYSLGVNDRKVRIPLREFSDADEMENQAQQVLLRLWLVDRNSPEEGIVICEILPKEESIDIIILEPPESPIQPVFEPSQMPCCYTCDHARTHHNNYWCRRYHWPQVPAAEFKEKYERFKCAEWRGEYFDATHNYWKR